MGDLTFGQDKRKVFLPAVKFCADFPKQFYVKYFLINEPQGNVEIKNAEREKNIFSS